MAWKGHRLFFLPATFFFFSRLFFSSRDFFFSSRDLFFLSRLFFFFSRQFFFLARLFFFLMCAHVLTLYYRRVWLKFQNGGLQYHRSIRTKPGSPSSEGMRVMWYVIPAALRNNDGFGFYKEMYERFSRSRNSNFTATIKLRLTYLVPVCIFLLSALTRGVKSSGSRWGHYSGKKIHTGTRYVSLSFIVAVKFEFRDRLNLSYISL